MKPILQALLLAERVYEDKTGKKIIVGTFNRIFVDRRPKQAETHPTDTTKRVIKPTVDLGSPFVYVSLTDLFSETELELQFVNVSTNQVLLQTPLKIQCASKLTTVEVNFALPPFPTYVSEPGTYSLDLLWRGEILGSHRVVVEEVK